MGRLTTLKPRLSSLPPRIGYPVGDEKARDKHRSATQHWRAWYKSARWLKLRQRILVRDLYTCQMPACRRVVTGKGQAIVDHKQPHHGNEALFWAEDNLQCLCKPCHDTAKQAQERRHPRGVGESL